MSLVYTILRQADEFIHPLVTTVEAYYTTTSITEPIRSSKTKDSTQIWLLGRMTAVGNHHHDEG